MKKIILDVEMKVSITRELTITDEEYEILLSDGTVPHLEEIQNAMRMGGCEWEVPEYDHCVHVEEADGTLTKVIDWDDE